MNNWNFDDSYDGSASPPTYTSDPYGFDLAKDSKSKSKAGGKSKDLYDFDMSTEDDSPIRPKKTVQNRMSKDERINEILRKSKSSAISKPPPASIAEDESNVGEDDWRSSWNQLMDGVGTEADPQTQQESPLTVKNNR
jgi:hypothetical protein